MRDSKLEEIIAMAIAKEEQSYAFYTGLKDHVKDPGTRGTLEFMAGEEMKHKEFLMRYRRSELGPDTLRLTQVVDYHIAEHLDPPDLKESLDAKDVYLVAAHREVRAHNFYTALAAIHPEGAVKEMLNRMANEELRHKEKVEYLYTNTAFPQTDGG
ncbi:MAG: ferritin family protein [Syntrophales bacterium LBB04]|nr:ferritin family protein [Syntrophales bacterium LBB04]